ncbi:hypothetical protein [Desulfovibrio sp. DV]|uniref:hypothetical protein n=1 Tax=Desulfovibrio sp. DV TaxID=1844708 RepID=UPI00094B82AB|nr:hypothetical protein [Desulfovibrio sp. DV]
MDIYLSSPVEAALDEVLERAPGTKLNVLLTIADMPSDLDAYFTRYGSIINQVALDCGKFSDNNSKLNITTQQLSAKHAIHLKYNRERYKLAFSFDESFEPDGFEINHAHLARLENLGIENITPVVHNLRNFEVNAFIRKGHTSVAIGKQEGKTNPKLLFPRVFQAIAYRLYVHLFGITEFNILVGCPATSCDSKSWLDDGNTGVVRYWNPAKQGENKTDVLYIPNEQGKMKSGMQLLWEYEYLDEFKRFVGNYGLTVYQLAGLKGGLYRQFLGMMYYRTLEDVVTELHRKNPLFTV